MGRSARRALLAVVLGANLLAVPARAAGGFDAAAVARTGRIEQGTPACGSCHGLAGEGVAAQQGPRLAGLDADYLARQLAAFAGGQRANPTMSTIARSLTPDQREQMADYFSRLPPAAATGPAPTGDRAHGQALAETGDWAHGVPACDACHGPGGLGVGAAMPPLRGQGEAYLLRQLQAFRGGARRGDGLGLMASVARRLSETDLRAAAAYYAGLPAAAPAGAGR